MPKRGRMRVHMMQKGHGGVTSMDILSKEKQSAEGLLNDAFGDSYYGVMASVKASNGAVEMESVLEVNFVHYEGSWQPFSAPSAKEKAYRAIQGPDESKIASNAMEVLRQADSESGGGQLRSLYADCTPKVSDAKFDESAQKATAKLVFEREDAFSSAKGTVSAAFAFENGTWCLTGVKASRDASDVSYDKLVGTWKGTFQSTVSHHRYGNCFGAQDKELTIKIDSVDAASGKVEGSFQGLVHYHAYLDADANECEGTPIRASCPLWRRLPRAPSSDGITPPCRPCWSVPITRRLGPWTARFELRSVLARAMTPMLRLQSSTQRQIGKRAGTANVILRIPTRS